MVVLDPQSKLQERVVCYTSAAVKHDVSASIMFSIAVKQGSCTGQWKRNNNGIDEVDPMLFNTAYLSELTRNGFVAPGVVGAGCYSVDLMAWRLRVPVPR